MRGQRRNAGMPAVWNGGVQAAKSRIFRFSLIPLDKVILFALQADVVPHQNSSASLGIIVWQKLTISRHIYISRGFQNHLYNFEKFIR